MRWLIASLFVLSAAAADASPRDTLITAAFQTPDKAQALAGVNAALAETEQALQTTPNDEETRLQHALAIGYRGKLTRKPGDAKQARREFEALAHDYPRDPEVQMALAGWHLEAIADIGSMLAGAVLGASKTAGYDALDRAITLGGDRALFVGYAALIRTKVDPSDSHVAALAARAIAAPAPRPLDRIFQSDAARLAPLLASSDRKAADALATQLLPFGRVH